MENFEGKTVIITGGSEGVGAATARKFAAAGAKLLLVARSKKNLEKIAEELRAITDVHIFVMDVSDAGACVDLFKKAEFEFGSVHVLINNAAFHKRGPAETIDADDLGRMIDTANKNALEHVAEFTDGKGQFALLLLRRFGRLNGN